MDQYDMVTNADYRYGEHSNFNYHKLVLQYLFEEYEGARETVLDMINLKKTFKDPIIHPQADFYISLTFLAVYGQVPEAEREKILTQVHYNQDTLEKLARSAPSNYLHKHHLVEAERMRVLGGEPDTIMHHYDLSLIHI